ncbi:MAG: hypothetical protein QM763_00940 [Agriterribacter sp.]
MKNFLRTRFYALSIIFFLLSTLTVKAGDDVVRPHQFDLAKLVRASVNFLGGNAGKAEILLEKLKNRQTDRICVCEIMELQNANAQYANVAVLAEKTNNGDMGKEYKLAERQITREKKQMKAQFFDDIKVNTRIAVATDCLSLYVKLKQESTGLKLYDILDADVRSEVK